MPPRRRTAASRRPCRNSCRLALCDRGVVGFGQQLPAGAQQSRQRRRDPVLLASRSEARTAPARASGAAPAAAWAPAACSRRPRRPAARQRPGRSTQSVGHERVPAVKGLSRGARSRRSLRYGCLVIAGGSLGGTRPSRSPSSPAPNSDRWNGYRGQRSRNRSSRPGPRMPVDDAAVMGAQHVDLIRDEFDRDPGDAAGELGLGDIDRLELQRSGFQAFRRRHSRSSIASLNGL